jgi:hypothetical protein
MRSTEIGTGSFKTAGEESHSPPLRWNYRQGTLEYTLTMMEAACMLGTWRRLLETAVDWMIGLDRLIDLWRATTMAVTSMHDIYAGEGECGDWSSL